MDHDHRADEARRDAPGSCPGERFLAVEIVELDAGRFGEFLAEEVGGSALERFAVLHHSFNGIGGHRAGEPLAGRFFAHDEWDRQEFSSKLFIDMKHPQRLFARFGLVRMGGMPFLPEEFCGAEKKAGAHFPANDVRPLVEQKGQIAIRFYLFCKIFPDDHFRRRTDDQRLFERSGWNELPFCIFFESVMRDDRAFGRKSFDVLGLFLQIAQGNKERKVGVLVPCRFEHAVENALDVFPQRIAPRFNDHAAADGRMFGEFGGFDDFLVPLGIIFFASRLNGCFHVSSSLSKVLSSWRASARLQAAPSSG